METQNLAIDEAAAKQAKLAQRQKKRKRTKRIIKHIIIWVLILAILAGGVWYVITSLKNEYTINYQAYTASTGTISNSLSFSGSLQLRYSKTYTSSSNTTVKTVYVKEGDEVKEGDKLLRLANGTTITSDIDGTVNQMKVSEGDEVSNGDTLTQIADFTHMYVTIRVDEYDINDVEVGDTCRITTTATEQTFESSIASINHISSSAGNVAYYSATAYVDVTSGVYPGMQVTITVPQEEAKDVVILKEDALSFDSNNRAFVYTFDENNNAVQTYVTTGISNGNYVEITDGISAGDTVYAVVETTSSTNALTSMLSGLFGGNNVPSANAGSGRSGSFDFSSFSADGTSGFPSMPSGGSDTSGTTGGGHGGFSGGSK